MATDLSKGIKELVHVPTNTVLFSGGGVVSNILLLNSYPTSLSINDICILDEYLIINNPSGTHIISMKSKTNIFDARFYLDCFNERLGKIAGMAYDSKTIYVLDLNTMSYKTKDVSNFIVLDDYRIHLKLNFCNDVLVMSYLKTVCVFDLNLNLIKDFNNNEAFGHCLKMTDGNFIALGNYGITIYDSSFRKINSYSKSLSIVDIKQKGDDFYIYCDDRVIKARYSNGNVFYIWERAISFDRDVFRNHKSIYLFKNNINITCKNRNIVLDDINGNIIKDIAMPSGDVDFRYNGNDTITILWGSYKYNSTKELSNAVVLRGDIEKIKTI